jgi:hypothetical protein
VTQLSFDETFATFTVVSDLDWIAHEIAAESSDPAAFKRQVNVRTLLLQTLQRPRSVPALCAVLAANGIDLHHVLEWYVPGSAVVPAATRLSMINAARDHIRPWLEDAFDRLAPSEQKQITTVMQRRHASLSAEAAKPLPRYQQRSGTARGPAAALRARRRRS